MLEAVRWLYSNSCKYCSRRVEFRAGMRSLVQVAHFNGGCSCAASAKGCDAALKRSMVCSHSTCTQVEEGARKSGVVGRSRCYQRSMVGRVVIEDGISGASVIEAVAISADSLPQTFFLEQISDWIAGIISLNQALVTPTANSPVGGPPAVCLPEGAQ